MDCFAGRPIAPRGTRRLHPEHDMSRDDATCPATMIGAAPIVASKHTGDPGDPVHRQLLVLLIDAAAQRVAVSAGSGP